MAARKFYITFVTYIIFVSLGLLQNIPLSPWAGRPNSWNFILSKRNLKSPLWVQIRDGSLIPKSKTLSIFIYAFKEHLVNTYYTPGTFLSTKDKTEVEKKTKTFPSWNSHPRREIDNKYIWQEMLWRIIKRSKGWCLSGQKVLLSYRIEEKTSLRNNRRTLMQGRVT